MTDDDWKAIVFLFIVIPMAARYAVDSRQSFRRLLFILYASLAVGIVAALWVMA